ncbi:MAG: hypothetical protein LBL93_00470 [Ruminococcus sp.]|jgi:hypothetical protein|nr:hypothetical protein [Ruminococcus sp.]
MALFKKNKSGENEENKKSCSSCSFGELSTDETFIICERRGRVEPNFCCIRYKDEPKLNIVTKSSNNEVSISKTTLSPSSSLAKKDADEEKDVDLEELKTLLKRIEARKTEFLDV